MDEYKSPIVKKAVGAIHIDSRRLSLLNRKIYNCLLFNAYPTMLEREEHAIPIQYLSELAGYDSHDLDHLKTSVKAMMNTVIEWNVLNDGKEEWGAAVLLGGVDFVNGLCIYSIPPNLKRKLHNPKIYDLIRIGVSSLFGSKYSLSMYENCHRYLRVGSTGWIDIDTLRRLLGVDTTNKLYSTFAEFNRRIIKPAIKEVNEVSDIEIFKTEYKRTPRAITSIKFSVRVNKSYKHASKKMEQLHLLSDDDYLSTAKKYLEKMKSNGIIT